MQSDTNTRPHTSPPNTPSPRLPSEKFMFYYPIKYELQFIRSHLKFQVTAHTFPNTFSNILVSISGDWEVNVLPHIKGRQHVK